MLAAMLVVGALLAMISAVLFQDPGLLGQKKVLTDFDSFYVAGTMAKHGRAAQAYDIYETLAAQKAFSGTPSFMPWTYPPPYTVLMAWLAHLPIGAAYALFTIGGLVFFLLVMRRIAGPYLPGALIAILPVVLLVVRTGQNGFYIGGLVGCFLLALLGKRHSAGVPLGMMILKPHLAAALALLTLLGRRWTTMAIAALIVVAALAGATVAFGPRIWPAFFGSVRDAGQFLASGYYPLYRMSSVYAALRSFHAPPALALATHVIVALAALGWLIHVWRRGYDPPVVAATACGATLLISPYNYDYDLTILGVGIAFALPKLIECSRRWELTLMTAMCWVATGYGLGASAVVDHEYGSAAVEPGLAAHYPPSLTALVLLPLLLLGHAVLRRAARANSVLATADTVGEFSAA